MQSLMAKTITSNIVPQKQQQQKWAKIEIENKLPSKKSDVKALKLKLLASYKI